MSLSRASLALSDVLNIRPVNAWLLMGDDASYPTTAELRDGRTSWPEGCSWTGPRQVQPGDLLFFYFMSPKKAVHFVARAASYPIFDPSIGVNAVKSVDSNQWWLTHTPLLPIEPVSFAALQNLFGGHLNLRGKPTHYLPPDVVRGLLDQFTLLGGGPSRSDQAVPHVPVGEPELPDPATATREAWAAMADGPLKLERQVEQYVVEPLLRHALTRQPDVSWRRAYRIKGGVPDYVVFKGDVPSGVVEVKLGVREPATGVWSDSPDFRQVTRYSELLDVPAVLVDSNRIFLIPKAATSPSLVFGRKTVTDQDMALVGRHLTDA